VVFYEYRTQSSFMSNNLVLTFEVYRGGALIKSAEFREESVTIGSGPSALLAIDDASVAELHAVINVEEDGSVQLLDLGSDGGTQLEGEAVSNAPLSSGSTVVLGNISIIVHITDDTAFDDDEATYVAAVPSDLDAEEGALVDEAAYGDAAATGAAMLDEDLPDDITEEGELGEIETEDIMTFIMRSGTAQSNLGIDRTRPKVLEVNQVWGDVLLDTKHYRKGGGPVTIGSATGYKWHFLGIEIGWVPAPLAMVLPFTPPMWSEVTSDFRNDFYAGENNLPSGREHNLFRKSGGGYVAEVFEEWDGFVDVGEQRYSFDELVAAGKAKKSGKNYEIPVDDETRLMVDVNGVVFFSHMVPSSRKIVVPILLLIDFLFLGILAFAAFLGLMFGLLIYFWPYDPSMSVVELDERFVELMLDKQKQEKKEDKKPSGNPDAGEGAKAKRDEGKVGKKDAKMQKAKGKKIQQQKMDRQSAENAGVLGALRDAGMMDGFGGALDADMVGGIGGLIGAKGTQIGSGGLGSRGSGLGGGGTAEGLGGLGTKGMGSGASGYGAGGGHFGAKGDGAIGAVGGDPIILGALDRSLIDEVIKRHMNQIRYCYQRELNKSPKLAGKIVIKFVIAKDGSVSSASTKSSTMKSSPVEQCIVGRFMRMQFPKPKGGGIVIVSYPFLFSPG
jgi:pSer/pThr/pTyr-binding forkhead associated (FHA) protein